MFFIIAEVKDLVIAANFTSRLDEKISERFAPIG